VYLGLIRNGDNASATGNILAFDQSANTTVFKNAVAGNQAAGAGIRLATSAGATSITYSYAAGTGTTQIPANIKLGTYFGASAAGSGTVIISNSGATEHYSLGDGSGVYADRISVRVTNGCKVTNSSSVALDIFLTGVVDNVLDGSAPQL
jgi:hypothetical protein